VFQATCNRADLHAAFGNGWLAGQRERGQDHDPPSAWTQALIKKHAAILRGFTVSRFSGRCHTKAKSMCQDTARFG